MSIQFSEIYQFKNGNGEIVECLKRPLEIGDRCVVLRDEKNGILLHNVTTGKHGIYTIKKLYENNERVQFVEGGGNWASDIVYQILE